MVVLEFYVKPINEHCGASSTSLETPSQPHLEHISQGSCRHGDQHQQAPSLCSAAVHDRPPGLHVHSPTSWSRLFQPCDFEAMITLVFSSLCVFIFLSGHFLTLVILFMIPWAGHITLLSLSFLDYRVDVTCARSPGLLLGSEGSRVRKSTAEHHRKTVWWLLPFFPSQRCVEGLPFCHGFDFFPNKSFLTKNEKS